MTAQIIIGGDPNKVDVSGYVKGDVLAANAAGTLEAVPVGPDGDVLTADSAALDGVDWQPGGGGGGGTPSNSVVTEQAFGQASTAGIATAYSRGDHTHGTPAAPSIPSAATTVVTETSFGQAQAVGVATSYAREDHTHGTPANPAPSASSSVVTETSFGQGSTAGVAATFSRGDHTHGTPAAPSVPSASGTVTAETTYGNASNAGAAATFSRGDHTHGTPSLGTTSTTAAAGDDSRITGAQQRSTLTTKGDLYVATANATTARQGVGTNGQFLKANSAQTNGIEWNNIAESDVTNLTTDLAAKAPLASPAFTGNATAVNLVLSGKFAITPDVLTFNATLATDASLGNYFRCTLTNNFTLSDPTNAVDGQKIMWELIQDGSGNRVITLDTKFALGTDIATVVLSTAINKRDFLGVVYNSTTDKFYVIAFVKGY